MVAMNNKMIKAMIKEKANNQEIHDLSEKIINKVDTSRVEVAPQKSPRRIRGLFSLIPVLGTACAVLLAILVVNLNKPAGDKGGVNNTDDGGITLPATPSNTIDLTEELIVEVYAQEVYTLVNLALEFDNISYDSVDLSSKTDKRMTVEEEKALVNDIDAYILPIEEMLGTLKVDYTCKPNTNTAYFECDKVLNIMSEEYEYNFFYKQVLVSDKNGKLDYDIAGVISTGSNLYKISGSEREADGGAEFLMRIDIDENHYLTLREDFDNDGNYYRYEFFNKDNERIKYIDIDQRESELDFRTTYEKTIISLNTDGSINCKIKSRDGDNLVITKDESSYTYTFKNSKNIYKKNLK